MTRRVIVGLPEWNLNGVSIFAANLVRGLRAGGDDARLFITEELTPLVNYPRVGPLPPDDVIIDRLRLGTHDRWSDAWIGIERYLEEHAPCVYIPNHDFRASSVTARLSSRVTVVGMIHSDNPLEYEHVARLGRHWDAVVAVNPAIRRRAAMEMPWLEARLATIPIGVSQPSQLAARQPSEVLRLIYHGELRAHQKRILDLVAMLDILVKRGMRVRLTLVGDGPARGEIEALGRERIADGSLVLLGARTHAETLAELSHHDVYVLASEFEGTPNALLEAMARGCVPVVSDIETLSNVIVHGETGLRFPPADIERFADAVASLAVDGSKRAAMAARAAAAVREGAWSLDAMLDAWRDLLDRIERMSRLSPRLPRAPMSVPPPTMGGVSILPGPFEGSARSANRVPLWPDPVRPAPAGRRREPHTAPLLDHRIVVAATSGRISGVDVFAVHLVRELLRRGLRAEILVTRPDEIVPDPLPFPADVPVRQLPVSPRSSWRERWANLVHDLSADVHPTIYIPNYDWWHSGISTALPAHVKVVGIVHSDDPQHYEHVVRLGRSWNAIVAVSDAIACEVNALAQDFGERTTVIPYGVPVPARPLRFPRSEGAPLRIVYAGRLARYQKRVLQIVDIADALETAGVVFELVVAGAGPDQGEFLHAAARHLTDGRIRYVGGVSNDLVQTLLARADAFLLPSAFEGLPVSLLEAMAQGAVPVVSAVRSGVPQLIRHEVNGFAIEPGDTAGFVARLTELALDLPLLERTSREAHATVCVEGYNVAGMGDAYVALFEHVATTPFERPFSTPRHPHTLAGLRSWLPPELPTLPQLLARTRQIARRVMR